MGKTGYSITGKPNAKLLNELQGKSVRVNFISLEYY